MTKEEKQLLLKDLCARLPHGVKVLYEGEIKEIQYIEPLYNEVKLLDHTNYTIPIYEVKPYLRPLSSMTEEEENEWRGFNIDPLLEAVGKPHTRIEDLMLRAKSQYAPLDWLNAHHFDYRGLIPMGLALKAPKDMYKTE